MKSRDVPVQIAHGWGGHVRRNVDALSSNSSNLQLMTDCAQPVTNNFMFSMSKKSRMHKSMKSAPATQSVFSRIIQASPFGTFGVETDSFDSSPGKDDFPANTNDDNLMKLVSSQNFDGSFRLESVLGQLLGTTVDDIRQGSYSSASTFEYIERS